MVGAGKPDILALSLRSFFPGTVTSLGSISCMTLGGLGLPRTSSIVSILASPAVFLTRRQNLPLSWSPTLVIFRVQTTPFPSSDSSWVMITLSPSALISSPSSSQTAVGGGEPSILAVSSNSEFSLASCIFGKSATMVGLTCTIWKMQGDTLSPTMLVAFKMMSPKSFMTMSLTVIL